MKHDAVFVLALLLSAAPLVAQEQTGTLQGKVLDESGSLLPGVTVSVKGPAILGGAMTVVTTESGYRVQNIPLGTYTVVFELSGFQTKAYEGVHVQAGTTSRSTRSSPSLRSRKLSRSSARRQSSRPPRRI